jgi:hypothetical protein
MKTQKLIGLVESARSDFIRCASGLGNTQAMFKPAPDQWCAIEIVEHLVWAERGGVTGIWKALEGIRNGTPVWEGEPPHNGLSIEDIVAKTWKEKEDVPEVAKPRWGGPLNHWITSLESCAFVLQKLGVELEEMDLEKIVYPHPISGPLNAIQRLEFLRFHLQRHQNQFENLKNHEEYPN